MNFDAGSLFSSVLISCIGWGYFRYGRTSGKLWPLLAGISMFIYPYFIPWIWLMWVICAALMVGVYLLREQ